MISLKDIYFTSAIFVSPLFHLPFANRSQFCYLHIVIGVVSLLCLSGFSLVNFILEKTDSQIYI